MSTVDPNLSPVIVVPVGGGSATLPDTPAAVLADAASPDTIVTLDSSGDGTSRGYAAVVGDGLTAWFDADPANLAGLRAALVDSTTYTFSVSTGVTLVNGTVGGSAAVTGGVLRCTVPATPAARYYGTDLEAPYGQIAVPRDIGGRQPLWWRARARVAAVPAGTIAYFLAISTDSTQRVGFYLSTDGSGNAENNVTTSGFASPWAAGTVPTDGTGWLEIEVLGDAATYRYGTGTTTDPPASWTTHATAALPTVTTWTNVRLAGASNSPPGSASAVDFGDLVFEVPW